MKFGKMSMLALSTMLGSSLMFSGEVSAAACTNKYPPTSTRWSWVNPDGSKIVEVQAWDKDTTKRRLFVYKGSTLVANLASGHFYDVLPKGYGTLSFATPNFDSCGNHTLVTKLGTFTN